MSLVNFNLKFNFYGIVSMHHNRINLAMKSRMVNSVEIFKIQFPFNLSSFKAMVVRWQEKKWAMNMATKKVGYLVKFNSN